MLGVLSVTHKIAIQHDKREVALFLFLSVFGLMGNIIVLFYCLLYMN